MRYYDTTFFVDKEIKTHLRNDSDFTWPITLIFSSSEFEADRPSVRFYIRDTKVLRNIADAINKFCDEKERKDSNA